MLVCWHALTVVFNTSTHSHNIEGSDIRGLVWHSLQTNICVRQALQNLMSDIYLRIDTSGGGVNIDALFH